MTDADAQPPISRYRLLVALMFALIAVFVVFVVLRGFWPARWQFSIEADTEVVEIKLRTGTRTLWQIDGAILCVRGEFGLDERFRMDDDEAPCRGRKWSAWQIDSTDEDFEREQVIELTGNTSVMIQLLEDGGVAMSLRAGKDEEEKVKDDDENEKVSNLGTFSIVGKKENVKLGSVANLYWTATTAQSYVLPFSGSTTLGRTVSWSSIGMLRSGSVVIYTADESADKRRRVDETELMLGDQVRLDAPVKKKFPWWASEGPWPKGFARIEPGAGVIEVVAYGEARGLRIERHGESGYDLRPGRFRKLLADPMVGLLGSLLAAYMTFVLALQPFVDDGKQAGPAADMLEQFKRWIRRQRAR